MRCVRHFVEAAKAFVGAPHWRDEALPVKIHRARVALLHKSYFAAVSGTFSGFKPIALR